MKNLLLPLILLSTITSNAIVILTQSNATPVIGSNYVRYMADTAIQEGASGPAATWIFNNLSFTTPFTTSCIDPLITGYSDSFPMCNVALDDDGNIQFINSSVTSMNLLGLLSSSGLLRLNSPITYFTFPFTYNSVSTNSNISGTFPLGTVVANYIATADAYGSLTVNGQTFNDVLRVKIDKNFSYNYTGIGILNEHAIDYAWFDGINPMPMLEIIIGDISGIISAHVKQVSISSLITKTDESSLSKDITQIFPNPANSQIKINVNNNKRINSIRLFNTSGIVCKEIEAGVEYINGIVDINDLPSGIYFLELITDRREVFKLIII